VWPQSAFLLPQTSSWGRRHVGSMKQEPSYLDPFKKARVHFQGDSLNTHRKAGAQQAALLRSVVQCSRDLPITRPAGPSLHQQRAWHGRRCVRPMLPACSAPRAGQAALEPQAQESAGPQSQPAATAAGRGGGDAAHDESAPRSALPADCAAGAPARARRAAEVRRLPRACCRLRVVPHASPNVLAGRARARGARQPRAAMRAGGGGAGRGGARAAR